MTKIDATILTEEEFNNKSEELNKLMATIDIYSNTQVADEKSHAIQGEFDDLSKNLYALDCAFLDAKVQAYTKVADILKSDDVKVIKR